jgi:hypothetical protein
MLDTSFILIFMSRKEPIKHKVSERLFISKFNILHGQTLIKKLYHIQSNMLHPTNIHYYHHEMSLKLYPLMK